ncbi:MAG: hypothetical protein U1F68_02700 [Gammaproteobacteria bacterium]
MYRAIYAYAWDLAQRPVAEIVAELRGLGLNTVTLATSYHAGKFLRPRAQTGKVYFPEDGTVYFKPRLERYGILRPQPNSMIEEQDPLAALCATKEIQANGWMVLLHNSRIGAEHPEATVRNAFGDNYIYSLCPSNPAVREYAINLCTDLADAYGVSGITLETPGFLPYTHGYHHEFAQVEHNSWLDALLGLCFCEHCFDGARQHGIDAVSLCQWVAERIEAYLASPVSAPPEVTADWLLADIVVNPDLGAFLLWRCAQVSALVSEIRGELRTDLVLAVIPTIQRTLSSAWLEGSDLNVLAQSADAVELPFYQSSAERIAADAWDATRRMAGGTLRGILRPGPPDITSRKDLLANLVALRSGGVKDFAFYNYGLLRPVNLRWMRDTLAALDSSGTAGAASR